MKIVKHWLQADTPDEKIFTARSGNTGGLIDPDYLVLHYTATDDARSAINWFMNTSNNPNKIAAHVVLDTDGTITQLVAFNEKANHAGPSTWDNVDFFNSHSIGIEIVNAGFVQKTSKGAYRRLIGIDKNKAPVYKSYPGGDGKIIKASHKHKFWNLTECGFWFVYPEAQMTALKILARALFENYQLVNALGHDDISPARKSDPGPAFPWDDFKQSVFGSTNNTGKIYTVNTMDTNLRMNPSTSATVLKKLPKGYEVGLIETNGQWSRVYLAEKPLDVLQKQGGKFRCIKTIGWIFSSLLSPKPL